MTVQRKSPRDEYWRERFQKARPKRLPQASEDAQKRKNTESAIESRALLTDFASLATDASQADPVLVQWVAKRVLHWMHMDFRRDAAPKAFGTALPDGAPQLSQTAEKRATFIAAVYWLHNMAGITLGDAFVEAADMVNLSEDTVRNEFQRFNQRWRDGSATTDEWLPVTMLLAVSGVEETMAPPRRGRPRKKSP